ncbi:phosphodiesterase [Microvirga roseola]|uniref:phosphodiesterase n=1 Tax=Microvirga roseola TaxID=2883126 RepID=UPI001E351478|nr:phosphodiesterase [Microvirga roseola]
MLIAHISDLHIRPRGELAYGVAETNVLAERAINALLRLRPRPDLVVLTGDATDCGLEEEFAILRSLLARLPMPVYAVPGNHDRRDAMRECFREGGYMAPTGYLNYVVETRPVRIISLDSLVPGASHGALAPETLTFLADALETAPEVPTIVCLHHPPVLCGIAHMDRIRLLEGAEEFATLIGRHPQVERILTGHHHRPIVTRFAGTLCQIAPSVAHQVALDLTADGPSAFVLEPPAFLLHHWTREAGLVTHMAYVDRAPGPFPFVLPEEYPGHS